MQAMPGHTGREIQDRVNRIQERAVPVVFENTPTALNRIVLAMVRWVIDQTHSEAILVRELDHPPHELGAPTMVLRTVIHVDHHRRDMGEAAAYRFPALDQPIEKTITGDLGGYLVDKQFVGCWQQDPDRRDGGLRPEIMVAGFGHRTAFAATGKRADLDGGLCID